MRKYTKFSKIRSWVQYSLKFEAGREKYIVKGFTYIDLTNLGKIFGKKTNKLHWKLIIEVHGSLGTKFVIWLWLSSWISYYQQYESLMRVQNSSLWNPNLYPRGCNNKPRPIQVQHTSPPNQLKGPPFATEWVKTEIFIRRLVPGGLLFFIFFFFSSAPAKTFLGIDLYIPFCRHTLSLQQWLAASFNARVSDPEWNGSHYLLYAINN